LTTNTLSFSIVVVHPCATTAIAPVVTNLSGGGTETGLKLSLINGTPTQLEDGKTSTISFTEAVAAANTAAGINICGTISYKLCTSNTCTGGTEMLGYTITADAANPSPQRYNLVLNPNTVNSQPVAIGLNTIYFVKKVTSSAYTGAVVAEGPFYY
jgi:hypothetical protein